MHDVPVPALSVCIGPAGLTWELAAQVCVAGNVALLCRASLCHGLAALACERDADLEYGIAVPGLAVLWAGCPCVRKNR